MFPPEFLSSIRNAAGFEEASFLEAHLQAAPPVSIRLNPEKKGKVPETELWNDPISWCQNGFYLSKRPVFTLDPLLHAGAYYVQEASSMFLEQAVRQVCHEITVRRAIDLCAAPGGKSTHLLSLLPPEAVLVSNEVIHSRAGILLENIIKWGSGRSMVIQNDPVQIGGLGEQFDLMVVDAPCSGSGLFRRDSAAMEEWSLKAVDLCSQRQQRILADALPALKAGGYLVYSTCSYSPGENEDILNWLQKHFGMEGVALAWPHGKDGVVAGNEASGDQPCYRFYPGQVRGEGFFMALLKKPAEEGRTAGKPVSAKITPGKWPPELKTWINQEEELYYYQHGENCFAMPREVWQCFQQWKPLLNIRKAGLRIAEAVHSRFNPAHDLALSTLIEQGAFSLFEASETEALSFLRKEDFVLPGGISKGWVLVTYNGLGLGWLKNLGNRCNNYYPKDWRIRMQANP